MSSPEPVPLPTSDTPRADAPGSPTRPPAARRRSLLPLVLVALAVLAAGGWRYRVTRPGYRFERGMAAVRAKDWDGAEGYADRLAATGRADHAGVLRAELLLARRRPGPALAALEGVNPDGPFKRPVAVLTGRCLLDLGNLPAAHRAFTEVLADNPDEVDAHRGLAAIAYDLGQTQQALAHFTRWAELDPADPRPHRTMGLIHSDAADLEPAEAAYRAALARNPSPNLRAELRDELALNLSVQKKYPEALEQVEAAATEAGGRESAGVAYIRADCYRATGRAAEAAAVLDRAIAADPGAAALHRLRGQLDLDADRLAAAVPRLEKAVALAPGDFKARHLLAQAYVGAGRQADADREFAAVEASRRDHERLTELSRLAAARPWDAGVRLQLAEAAERIGNPKVAAMWRSAAAALTNGR